MYFLHWPKSKKALPATWILPSEEPRALEALANPDCGWFYRADASSFEAISGNPIAYWASKKTLNSFALPSLKQKMETRVGMATADNDRFLRCWWEVPLSEFSAIESSRSSAAESKAKWFPYTKGGEYRKWYGNREFVVNWENDGDQIRNNIDPKTGRVKSHKSASGSQRMALQKRVKKLQDQLKEASDYEQEVAHYAEQMIAIDLDDGVKVNYAKFGDLLAKIK